MELLLLISGLLLLASFICRVIVSPIRQLTGDHCPRLNRQFTLSLIPSAMFFTLACGINYEISDLIWISMIVGLVLLYVWRLIAYIYAGKRLWMFSFAPISCKCKDCRELKNKH